MTPIGEKTGLGIEQAVAKGVEQGVEAAKGSGGDDGGNGGGNSAINALLRNPALLGAVTGVVLGVGGSEGYDRATNIDYDQTLAALAVCEETKADLRDTLDDLRDESRMVRAECLSQMDRDDPRRHLMLRDSAPGAAESMPAPDEWE